MHNIFQKYKLKRSWNCEKSLRKPHHAFEEAFHEIDVQFFSDTIFCVQSCKITVIWLRRWSVIRQIVYQNVGCSIFRWCLSIYFASSRRPVQICSLRDPPPHSTHTHTQCSADPTGLISCTAFLYWWRPDVSSKGIPLQWGLMSLGGVAGLGVPVRSGPMYRKRGGGPCTAKSNASWIVVTWDPSLWAEWLTDSHVWKHYRPAILLAAGNNIHLCKSFQCGIPFQRGATSSREEFQWHCNYISISTSSQQPKENQNHFCIALITHTYFRSQVKVWWLGIFRWSTCVILCGPHWHDSTKMTL